MLRVSLRTNNSWELTPLNPRERTDHEVDVSRATNRPGTNLRASGTVVAPERRMSSAVSIDTAAAAFRRLSGVLDTEVTSTSISCSMLSRLSAVGVDSSSCANVRVAVPRPKTTPAMIHTGKDDSNILPKRYNLEQ